MKETSDLNRRAFLKHSGTAAAALGASLAAAPAVIGGDSSTDKIRLGWIGTGGRGSHLMTLAMQNPDVQIAAVCDPSDDRLKRALELTDQKAKPYKDFRQVLERQDIDAVFITSPDHWHCIQTIAACEAGKDVYVEKPISHNIAEGRAAVNAAQKHNRIVQVGTQQLSGQHYAASKELIRSGALGKITRVRVWNVWNEAPQGIGNPPDEPVPPGLDYDLWLGPAPQRPYNRNRFSTPGYWYMWDYSGGYMLAWTIHHVDTAHWTLGLGAPKLVMSVGGKYALEDNRDAPDTQDALIDYGNLYIQATVYHSNARPIEGRDYGIAYYGTNGTLRITRDGFEVFPEGGPGSERTKAIQHGGSAQEEPHIRNFLDCVKSRKQPHAPLAAGHLTTNPLHLANMSLRTGRAMQWDAANELVIGDEEANRRFLCRAYRKPWGEYVKRHLSPVHVNYIAEA
ncbi:MAG: Gfo/Idh/MocA family oxidoreductase [Chloroflexi bacterium]|nr:Gfo/Idh/MocA family oxidoreductase [Chloroflexota bacterium]